MFPLPLFVSFPQKPERIIIMIKNDQTQGNAWRKQALLFLGSQNISLFGSSVVSYAVIWYITMKTSSGFWLMLATICSMAPQVLISLWSGVWADRYNRKHLIMLADGFTALSTLALAVLFFLGFRSMHLLLVVAFLRSIGAGVQTPAVSAIFPQLVPQEKLTKVQGINQTLNSVLQLLAPAAGGAVLASFGIEWTFLLDVSTALLAIAIFSRIRVGRAGKKEGENLSVLAEFRQGLRYTFGHPQLRRIMICYAFSFFLITPAAVLTPLLVQRSFGNDVWRLTVNEMIWTVGSLVGGVFISLRGEFRDKVKTIAVCLAGFGVTFGLLGVARPFWVYLAVMGAAGFFLPVIVTAQTVFIQEITEPSIMGRVFSIVQIIASSSVPVAILLFGPLADVIPVEWILIVTGALLTLVGVLYHLGSRPDAEKETVPQDGG